MCFLLRSELFSTQVRSSQGRCVFMAQVIAYGDDVNYSYERIKYQFFGYIGGSSGAHILLFEK